MNAERIALHARMYRLLADRPEYGRRDRAERVAVVVDSQVRLGLYDEALIASADEPALLCGYAVRSLGTTRRAIALLDVLGTLHPERLVAMYHAVPANRRRRLLSDPVWAHHIARAPHEEIADHAERIGRLADTSARCDTAHANALAHSPEARQAHTFARAFRREVLSLAGEAGA